MDIDIVIPWVDSNDEEWQKRKLNIRKQEM